MYKDDFSFIDTAALDCFVGLRPSRKDMTIGSWIASPAAPFRKDVFHAVIAKSTGLWRSSNNISSMYKDNFSFIDTAALDCFVGLRPSRKDMTIGSWIASPAADFRSVVE